MATMTISNHGTTLTALGVCQMGAALSGEGASTWISAREPVRLIRLRR